MLELDIFHNRRISISKFTAKIKGVCELYPKTGKELLRSLQGVLHDRENPTRLSHGLKIKDNLLVSRREINRTELGDREDKENQDRQRYGETAKGENKFIRDTMRRISSRSLNILQC